ncbi:MAG: alcohol dehydrogenase catalytic domain-containing protein [Thermodesulfobacteriota bacterium]|nr:alcohol dehydrogenase catalytic domain-containing protein [Thermodesulfobacteriota bacterium]
MKKAFLVGPGKIVIRRDAPSPAPVLKVQACGICRTDRKGFHMPPSSMGLPRILGHEVSGILCRDFTELNLSQGDRVVLWPALCCGRCRFCLSGRENLCSEITLFGCHLDGGFGAEIGLPSHFLNQLVFCPIPETLDFIQASLAEPLGCVLHALGMAADLRPRSLLILGAGLMGRLAGRTARVLWPESDICLHDLDERRLLNCRDEGKKDRPRSADLVFLAASSREAFYTGLRHLEPGGLMILFSGFSKQEREVFFDHNLLHRREQRLAGAYGCCSVDMRQALDLIASGAIEVNDLVTQIIALEQVEDELQRQQTPNDYKTVIVDFA